jgi:hypothetical protein
MARITAQKATAADVEIGDVIASSKKAVESGKGRQVVTIDEAQVTRRFMDENGRTISRPRKSTELWRAGEAAEDELAPPKASTNSKPSFEWPKAPAEVLVDYLKAEVTDAQDAPNRAKPFINEKGVVHLHSSDWRHWLAEQGLEPTKAQAAEPLRAAGLKVRAVPLPGEDRALGFYIGKAPSGAGKLPRRKAARRPRQARPFGRPNAEQVEVLGRALTALEFADDEAELAKVRDELLATLEANG